MVRHKKVEYYGVQPYTGQNCALRVQAGLESATKVRLQESRRYFMTNSIFLFTCLVVALGNALINHSAPVSLLAGILSQSAKKTIKRLSSCCPAVELTEVNQYDPTDVNSEEQLKKVK